MILVQGGLDSTRRNAISRKNLDTAVEEKRLVTQKTLRKILGGITEQTLIKWMDSGVLPAPMVINRRNYWPLVEISEWLAKQERRPSPVDEGRE